MDARIEQVRRFNRTVAEGIGALEEHFLGRRRPMAEARLLWEIGDEGADVRELRTRLDLDSGYLSRLLRSLEGQRLVRIRVSPADGRVHCAQLTRLGLAEWRELDRRSDDVAKRMLEPLTDVQRSRFLTAIGDVERLLNASMVQFAIEPPTTADARWCLAQYFDELDARFERGFDAAQSLPASADELTPPRGALLIARLRGRPIGCGAVKFHAAAPAELKRMWIAQSARGTGVGRRLLVALEEEARKAGAAVVRLETNRALKEAIALYRSSGYVEVAPFNSETYAHHWFEKRLTPRSKKRALASP